jgi:nitroreductase
METWDAIRARRNVRRYTDRRIAPEDIDLILEAGRRSPSAGNQQAWDFVVVTEGGRLRDLAKVWRGAGHVATSAATVAIVVPITEETRTRELIQLDLGQASMSMMIAAASLGIGSGHAAVADQDLARQILGHPTDRTCAFMIAFGYPADRPLAPIAHPDRRPFDDVVHRERW